MKRLANTCPKEHWPWVISVVQGGGDEEEGWGRDDRKEESYIKTNDLSEPQIDALNKLKNQLNNKDVILLEGVGKTYKRFAKPSDRFWQAVWPRAGSVGSQKGAASNEFVALAPLNLQVKRGEALRNVIVF